LRYRLEGRRICQLLTLVWLDDMARRTVLLSQTPAAVGVCSKSVLAGEHDGIQ
jgi:hypothetical protein